MSNSNIYLITFFVYMIAMVYVGWRVSRNQKTGEDFLMGGRSLPFFLMFGTIIATLVGTGSSMGAVGYAYRNGAAGALYGIGGGIGIFLLVFLFSDVRKYNFMTMSEEISFYYGANKFVKSFVAILMIVAEIGWLGAHILGGAMYFSWITGVDLTWSKAIVAFGFFIYTFIGGYLAVVWTDTIQAVILFVGFILMAAFSIPAAGGWHAIVSAVPAVNLSLFGIDKVGLLPAISLAVVIGVGVLATPSYRHRIYSGKNIGIVKKSFLMSAAAYLVFSIIPVIVGLAAFTINPTLANVNYAFPYMATEVLPVWMGAIILVAGLSATMSSGSSDAIASVTILLRDVYVIFTKKMPPEEKMITYSRVALFLAMGAAFIFTIFSTDILSYIQKMVSTVMTGLFVIAVLGKFWKRATWQGGLAALLGGSAVALYINGSAALTVIWGNAVIPSLIASFVAGIVISLITPRNTVSKEESLRILAEERNMIEGKKTVTTSDSISTT